MMYKGLSECVVRVVQLINPVKVPQSVQSIIMIALHRNTPKLLLFHLLFPSQSLFKARETVKMNQAKPQTIKMKTKGKSKTKKNYSIQIMWTQQATVELDFN